MGVTGPVARTVADLALLLSVQAGYDPRAPLSMDADASLYERRPESELKGKRIAWAGDFNGHAPCEPELLDVCRSALKTFEALGCTIEEALPDYPLDRVWRAFTQIRSWRQGATLLPHYHDPSSRALLKPEAIFEIEEGMKLSAYDIASASTVRTEWYQATRSLFDRYDYLVAPTAQVFPFDIDLTWPRDIAGRRMQTYHEWMMANCLISMSGSPSLAVPAGFSDAGLPIGLQIVAPFRGDASCLQLAYAYERATDWRARPPQLLQKS
jgi:amidase